jgi:hypothetical protein
VAPFGAVDQNWRVQEDDPLRPNATYSPVFARVDRVVSTWDSLSSVSADPSLVSKKCGNILYSAEYNFSPLIRRSEALLSLHHVRGV